MLAGMAHVTGEQFDLTLMASTGRISATVTEVGAGIRRLSIDGVDLVPPYDADVQRPAASGIVLVPWPNRVRDGLWRLDGAPQQLDITEVDRANAIHGLLRFTSYRVSARTEASITLGARVNPQHGYPFALETSVTYELVDAGLEVTHRVTNMADAPAPVALGAHPFFTIGDVEPEDLTLTLACATHIDVDDRMLPVGETPVEGTDLDLRQGRRLVELTLDDGYADAEMHDGICEHHLAAPDGRTVTVWGDENFAYWQVFTTATYPGQSKALAIEPMTAPADAFNSGRGLRWVAPSETWQASWGVRADGFARV